LHRYDWMGKCEEFMEKGQLGPRIDYTICSGCGSCIEWCPEGAIVMSEQENRPRIQIVEACTYCGVCEKECPQGAISLAFEIVFGDE